MSIRDQDLHPLVRRYSASERAAVCEREIVSLLDSGQFHFRSGVGRLARDEYQSPCGCALGALMTVAGSGKRFMLGASLLEELVATGLATNQELVELEQGYEYGNDVVGNPEHDHNRKQVRGTAPFFQVGCRLRARPDATPMWSPKRVQP